MPGKSPDGVPLLLRVEGCLSAHWRHWQAIGAESWVLSVLRVGYRITFKDSPPPLQTVDCPLGLHSGVCSGICVGTLPRDSSSQVPGRVAGPRLFGDGGQKERPGSALALSLPWDIDKQIVRFCPLADCKLPRYDHRYQGRQDFSVLGEVGSSQSTLNALSAVAFEDALVS